MCVCVDSEMGINDKFENLGGIVPVLEFNPNVDADQRNERPLNAVIAQ